VGFIFFNAGSTMGILKVQGGPQELWQQAQYAACNTFMAGCGAGLFSLIFKAPLMNGWHHPRHVREEAGGVCNAFLAGMVANGGGMNDYEPWAAWVVGLIGGIVYCLLCKLFDILKIDDAVEAVELHGGAGSTGVFCNAFFRKDVGYFYGYSKGSAIFGYQLMGWVCIALWSFLCSSLIWGILKCFGLLRTDLKTEVIGYDYIEFAEHLDFTGKRLVKKAHSHKHPHHDHLDNHHDHDHHDHDRINNNQDFETPKEVKFTNLEMTPPKGTTGANQFSTPPLGSGKG